MANKTTRAQEVAYVVLDTNVLVYRTRLLSTALGAAFVYSLDRTGNKIGLPEVIELEMQKHTTKTVQDAISEIDNGYRIIEVTMGRRDDYKVPSVEEIEDRVTDRLEELGKFIERVPFTFDHAKSTLERVIQEIPPNRPKDLQFKDSAIWEAVLDLSDKGEVHFITDDKDFFQDRDPTKGLAAELKADVDAANKPILVHYGLDKYLEEIQEEIPELDRGEIANLLKDSLIDQLLERAAGKDYQLGELSSFKIDAFVTERPHLLAVEFRLEFEAFDVPAADTGELLDGIEIVEGSCSYDTADRDVRDIQLDEIVIQDLAGDAIPGLGHVMIRAGSAVLGRRIIPHRVREPLPSQE